MTIKRTVATAAAVAIGFLAAATPALAQEPQGFLVDGPFSAHQGEPNRIIAILIGFTPPIGSNKGS
jgi:hypothetical protein